MAKKKSTHMTQPIRVGIIGLGRAGFGMHCEELKDKQGQFTIAAGCDVHEPWRARMAQAYPKCRIYTRLRDLLKDPEVDLVSVATHSVDHYRHAAAALRAGKHVLVEKPMCISYSQAKRLVRLAETCPGKLFVRYNRRFEPAFLHIREIIASGVLGEIVEVRLLRTGYQRRNDWQTLMEYGGGLLLNWGPHVIDHGLQLLGAPGKPLKKVWGSLRRIAAAGDAEDHLHLVLEGASGCVADVTVSGGAALGGPQYLIWGTKGALRSDGETIELKHLHPKKKLKARFAKETPPEGFDPGETLPWVETSIPVAPKNQPEFWDALYRAIQGWQPFPVTLDESLEVMRVVSEVKKGSPFVLKKQR